MFFFQNIFVLCLIISVGNTCESLSKGQCLEKEDCLWNDSLCTNLKLGKIQQSADEIQVVQVEFTVNGVNEYNFASVAGPITEALENELDEPMNVILQQHEEKGKMIDRQILAEIQVEQEDAPSVIEDLQEKHLDLVAGIEEALLESGISGVTIDKTVRISLVLEDRESSPGAASGMNHLVVVDFLISGIAPHNFPHAETSLIEAINGELDLEETDYKVLAAISGFYNWVRVQIKTQTRQDADLMAQDIAQIRDEILVEVKEMLEEDAPEIQVHSMNPPQVVSSFLNHAEGRTHLRETHRTNRKQQSIGLTYIIAGLLGFTIISLAWLFSRCYMKTHQIDELNLDLILDEVDPERSLSGRQTQYSMRV